MECSGIEKEGKDTFFGASVLLALAADPIPQWNGLGDGFVPFFAGRVGWVLCLLIPFREDFHQ
jgi:hypothetical protein